MQCSDIYFWRQSLTTEDNDEALAKVHLTRYIMPVL